MKTWSFISLLSGILVLVLLMSSRSDSVLFQKVVPMPTFSLAQLRSYSLGYFQNEEYTASDESSLTANADSTCFQFEQEFMVYNRTVLKHPVGSVTYRATIDLKEEKIRYTADSTYFLKYSRNRYSRYVPVSAPPIPFSEWQTQWHGKEVERFRSQIRSMMEAHLQAFVHTLEEKQETQVNATKLEAW